MPQPGILLTGATGYIGQELLPEIERAGRRVRCMVRNPRDFAAEVMPGTEIVYGDVRDAGSLAPALEGIDTAYYLIHSMGYAQDFEAQDRDGARNFASAAQRAGVRKIIYLGGLGESGGLSSHLRSRQEVGEILRGSGVPVLEFRAAVVIGCGSLSFEIIRALVERLPVMITPRWVRTPTQPIAISDLLAYLRAALELDPSGSRILEIGGAAQTAYGGLMREYARQRNLKRAMIPVPLLTPHLSSLWLGLVTPFYARVGKKLVEGLLNPTIVKDDAARKVFPEVRPVGLDQALKLALEAEDAEFSTPGITRVLVRRRAQKGRTGWKIGTRYIDSYEITVPCAASRAFAPIQRIGGKTGWYYANWLWRLRGMVDRGFGGIGLRRGRRHPVELRIGEKLDFWEVADYVPDRRLFLRAEMKLPGRAWLDFQVEERGKESLIRQTAMYDTRGLLGVLYWQALGSFHKMLFSNMLRAIGRQSAVKNI
jgi:uncharacterized protein YbjT (DUF2867 family)